MRERLGLMPVAAPPLMPLEEDGGEDDSGEDDAGDEESDTDKGGGEDE